MSIWKRTKKKMYNFRFVNQVMEFATPTKETKEYRGNKYTIFRGKSEYIWILDAGHGGMIEGVYQTEGKRSPIWDDGTQLFEGVSNRGIISMLSKELVERNISHVILVDTNHDTPLKIRTDLANIIAKKEKLSNRKCIYVSIHSDAWKTKSAHGWSVFTTPGPTLSDKVAEVFALEFLDGFPNEKIRKDTRDGDLDKEAKFWVLKKTSMPAILTENFFMTNPHECQNILLNKEGRSKIVELHLDAIIKIEKNKTIS